MGNRCSSEALNSVTDSGAVKGGRAVYMISRPLHEDHLSSKTLGGSSDVHRQLGLPAGGSGLGPNL